MTTVFASGEDQSLVMVKPAEEINQKSKALFYFAMSDLSQRTDHVHAFSYMHNVPQTYKVFSQDDGSILAIKRNLSDQLLLLDSNLYLTVTKMTSHSDFEVQTRISLRNNMELRYSLKALKPYQQIEISERAILIDDKLYSINSGADMKVDEGCKIVASQQDVLVFAKGDSFSVRNQPDSRGMLLSEQFLRQNVRSVHHISCDLLLFEMRNTADESPYWALISTHGKQVPIPCELEALLSERKWKSVVSCMLRVGRC